jgi:hypothetical protein
MSRTTRIVLAVLVSLGVIIGIFTSVEGASLTALQDKAGAHLVSGSMVNLDHYRAAQPELMQAPVEKQGGHDCESDMQTAPYD